MSSEVSFANFNKNADLIAICCLNKCLVQNIQGVKVKKIKNAIKTVICASFSPNNK